jgi:hypothetical protein
LNRPQLCRHSACDMCCSCKRASEFARAAALGCSALSCARCPPATSHRAATHRAMSGPSASLTDHRLATTSSGRLAAQGHGTREYCTAVSHSRPSTTIGRPTSVGTQSLRTSSSSGFGLNLACSKSRNSMSAVHSSHTPSCASWTCGIPLGTLPHHRIPLSTLPHHTGHCAVAERHRGAAWAAAAHTTVRESHRSASCKAAQSEASRGTQHSVCSTRATSRVNRYTRR